MKTIPTMTRKVLLAAMAVLMLASLGGCLAYVDDDYHHGYRRHSYRDSYYYRDPHRSRYYSRW